MEAKRRCSFWKLLTRSQRGYIDFCNLPYSKQGAHTHVDTDNEVPTVESTLSVLYPDAEIN